MSDLGSYVCVCGGGGGGCGEGGYLNFFIFYCE